MPTDAQTSPSPALTPLLAAAVCGSLLPLQSRANGVLSEQLGALPAATMSFGSGLVVLTLLLAIPGLRRHASRIPAGLRTGRLRWWQILGGVGGGLLVASQTYSVPLAGVTAFLIAFIGGQSVSALLVDRFGLGPAPAQPVQRARVLAAVLAVIGVAVAASAPGRGGSGSVTGLALAVPIAAVFLAGCLVSVQQGFNGVVTTVTRDPLATTWLNFLTGTCTLVLIGTVVALAGGPGPQAAGADLPWWAWSGGMVGIGFIVLAAWAVQHLPVLVFVLVTVTTQLLVGVLLDLADPQSRELLGPQVLMGVALALVASVWAALARRGHGSRAPREGAHR